MGTNDFSRRDCIRALRRLGFSHDTSRHGRHDKFLLPQHLAATIGSSAARFIMVPRHRQLRCQREIVQELRAMGGDELVQAFTAEL